MVQITRVEALLGIRVFAIAALFVPALTLNAAETPGRSEADLAQQILQSTGITGGVVVHVGCGDGKLTAALRPRDGYLVHGLDTDAENGPPVLKKPAFSTIFRSVYSTYPICTATHPSRHTQRPPSRFTANGGVCETHRAN